jgi:hypothetical protein
VDEKQQHASCCFISMPKRYPSPSSSGSPS